jgi:hypothetical protein
VEQRDVLTPPGVVLTCHASRIGRALRDMPAGTVGSGRGGRGTRGWVSDRVSVHPGNGHFPCRVTCIAMRGPAFEQQQQAAERTVRDLVSGRL